MFLLTGEHAKSLQLYPTLCNTMDYSLQAPLSTGFSRQEYWSGLPCLPPGDLPNPGIKSTSLKSPAPAGVFFTTSTAFFNRRTGPQLAKKKAIKAKQNHCVHVQKMSSKGWGKTAELKFPVYLFSFYFNVEPPSSN